MQRRGESSNRNISVQSHVATRNGECHHFGWIRHEDGGQVSDPSYKSTRHIISPSASHFFSHEEKWARKWREAPCRTVGRCDRCGKKVPKSKRAGKNFIPQTRISLEDLYDGYQRNKHTYVTQHTAPQDFGGQRARTTSLSQIAEIRQLECLLGLWLVCERQSRGVEIVGFERKQFFAGL